jgi:hypothetical protein
MSLAIGNEYHMVVASLAKAGTLTRFVSNRGRAPIGTTLARQAGKPRKRIFKVIGCLFVDSAAYQNLISGECNTCRYVNTTKFVFYWYCLLTDEIVHGYSAVIVANFNANIATFSPSVIVTTVGLGGQGEKWH